MKQFFAEHAIECLFGIITFLITTIAGIVIKFQADKHKKKVEKTQEEAAALIKQKEEDYQRLLEEEKTRNYRQMIISEIEPLVEEIHRIKFDSETKINAIEQHIQSEEEKFDNKIESLKKDHSADKNDVYDKLEKLKEKHNQDIQKILESYKFRFIQLCKTHLKDGYITPEEWEQIVAFYNLYHSLGGNGQAEDYFEQVKKLDIIDPKEQN